VPLVINGIVVVKEKTTQYYFTELLEQYELPNGVLEEAQA
jgi:hypothetical protein